jgi:hypothetical protein
MTITRFLSSDELPKGFEYPLHFLRLSEQVHIDLSPWHIIEGKDLRHLMSGLRRRYPARRLVPFAFRQDNDDVACWSIGQGDCVLIIHDFASPGWEQRERFEDFNDWLLKATEDSRSFNS